MAIYVDLGNFAFFLRKHEPYETKDQRTAIFTLIYLSLGFAPVLEHSLDLINQYNITISYFLANILVEPLRCHMEL